MKMPNEPESTACAASGLALSLSFLSPAEADTEPSVRRRLQIKLRQTKVRPFNVPYVPVCNFTQHLLVRCVSRFFEGPVFPRFWPQLLSPCGCPFPSSRWPSYSSCAASHEGCEIVPCCSAADVQRPSRSPAGCNAATTARRERLKKPRVPRWPAVWPHFLPAQKRRRQAPRCGPLRRAILPAPAPEPHARPGGTPVHRSPGKSPPPYALRAVGCGRRDLRTPNSDALPGPGRRSFFPHP